MNNIRKHLKKKDLKEQVLLQGRLDKNLYTRLRLKLGREKISVSDFVEAAAKAFLEETK